MAKNKASLEPAVAEVLSDHGNMTLDISHSEPPTMKRWLVSFHECHLLPSEVEAADRPGAIEAYKTIHGIWLLPMEPTVEAVTSPA